MRVTSTIFLSIFHICCATLNILDPSVFSVDYHKRQKRVIVNDCISIRSCCDMGPEDDEISLLDKNCRRKLGFTGALSKEQKMCVNECIAKNLGYYDVNGVLNVEYLRDVLYQNLSKLHEWLEQDYVDPILDICIQASIDNMGMRCNGEVQLILHCVVFEAQSLCPESYARDIKKCLNLLSYMEKHASYPPRKYWC